MIFMFMSSAHDGSVVCLWSSGRLVGDGCKSFDVVVFFSWQQSLKYFPHPTSNIITNTHCWCQSQNNFCLDWWELRKL